MTTEMRTTSDMLEGFRVAKKRTHQWANEQIKKANADDLTIGDFHFYAQWWPRANGFIVRAAKMLDNGQRVPTATSGNFKDTMPLVQATFIILPPRMGEDGKWEVRNYDSKKDKALKAFVKPQANLKAAMHIGAKAFQKTLDAKYQKKAAEVRRVQANGQKKIAVGGPRLVR